MSKEGQNPQAKGLVKVICLLRALVGDAFVIVFTAFYGTLATTLVLTTRSRRVGDFMLRTWSQALCFMFNIQVEARGLENLPDEGVLFVFNHSSHFDIPVFHVAIPKTARFGAKIELYKIPIFAQTLKALGALPITRGDRDKVLELYKKSVPRVHAGESFVLAGEGTRMETPGVGEKFKSGPFIFAIEGQFPLVPVVIRGAAEILPKGKLLPGYTQWRSPVVVRILKPIATKGLSHEDRPRLQEEVRILMTKAFQEE